MSQNLFDKLCRAEGYCCPMMYLSVVRHRTAIIAKRLGVSPRTVRKWKEKYKNRKLTCTGNCKRKITWTLK